MSPASEPSAAVPGLPATWAPGQPSAADVPELHALLLRHEQAARGASSAAAEAVESDVVGAGAESRRHRLLRDGAGRVRAWGTVHDRAAGRSLVAAVVDPDLSEPVADAAAADLLGWVERVCGEVGRERGLAVTQIDSGAFSDDARQQRWLATAAGLAHVRSWWQMSRPVDPAEGRPGHFPEPSPGVIVRRVGRDATDGLPLQRDLAAIHAVLEAAFTDHFNYHEETFEEFCSRLREDPGHRWDHWWIAEVDEDGTRRPAGALIGAVSPGGEGPGGEPLPDSGYVEYLGVLRSARGRGVASTLLHAVFSDAAGRGRPSVGIEVDEDSSTGAAGLYLSMGFVTAYVTQSWHRDLPVPVAPGQA